MNPVDLHALPLARSVRAQDLPLDRLATNPHVAETDKVREVSRQFEAVLLRQVLREAQTPVFKSTLTPASATSSVYRDLLVEHLADGISRSNSLGLARSLAGQLHPPSTAERPAPCPAAPPVGAFHD